MSGVVPPLSVPAARAMFTDVPSTGLPNVSPTFSVTGFKIVPAVVLFGWLR